MSLPSSSWRLLLPREHGLIAWVFLPAVLAVALAPGRAALAGALGLLAGFGAFNARRAGADRVATLAGGLAALGGLGALAWGDRPLASGAVFLVGAAALPFSGRGRVLPRDFAAEIVVLCALSLAGAGLGIGAGAPVAGALTAAAVLAAWQLVSLCWIRTLFAELLPNRVRPAAGPPVAASAVAAAALIAWGAGHLLLAAALGAWLLRATLHAPPLHPQDARRVGLTELAWGAALVVGLGLALPCGA